MSSHAHAGYRSHGDRDDSHTLSPGTMSPQIDLPHGRPESPPITYVTSGEASSFGLARHSWLLREPSGNRQADGDGEGSTASDSPVQLGEVPDSRGESDAGFDPYVSLQDRPPPPNPADLYGLVEMPYGGMMQDQTYWASADSAYVGQQERHDHGLVNTATPYLTTRNSEEQMAKSFSALNIDDLHLGRDQRQFRGMYPPTSTAQEDWKYAQATNESFTDVGSDTGSHEYVSRQEKDLATLGENPGPNRPDLLDWTRRSPDMRFDGENVATFVRSERRPPGHPSESSFTVCVLPTPIALSTVLPRDYDDPKDDERSFAAELIILPDGWYNPHTVGKGAASHALWVISRDTDCGQGALPEVRLDSFHAALGCEDLTPVRHSVFNSLVDAGRYTSPFLANLGDLVSNGGNGVSLHSTEVDISRNGTAGDPVPVIALAGSGAQSWLLDQLKGATATIQPGKVIEAIQAHSLSGDPHA